MSQAQIDFQKKTATVIFDADKAMAAAGLVKRHHRNRFSVGSAPMTPPLRLCWNRSRLLHAAATPGPRQHAHGRSLFFYECRCALHRALSAGWRLLQFCRYGTASRLPADAVLLSGLRGLSADVAALAAACR